MITTLVTRFQTALAEEIDAAQRNPVQGFRIYDGQCLGKSGDGYAYAFRTYFDLAVPDDSPAVLEVEGSPYEVVVVTCEQLTVSLHVPVCLGDHIPKAILKAEPLWLLVELSKRLECVPQPEFHLNGELVLKCLGVVSSSSGDPSPEVVAKLGLENRLLNREQKGAVLRVLGSEAGFVWGPPATGKTRTAGETIAALHSNGESVLAMAHSNVAVDVLTLAAAQAMAGTEALNGGEILRLGTPRLQAVRDLDLVSPLAVVAKQNPDLFSERDRLRRSVSESGGRGAARRLNLTVEPSLHLLNLQSRLVKIHAEISDLIIELISRARVILTTFAKGSVCELVYTRRFDASMVDEASMAMLAQVAFAASLAQKRIAIFGDFRQLPPIVRARTRMATEYLGQDIFAVSGIEARADAQLPDPRLVTLRVQYRMAPAICAVVNGPVYKGLLVDAATVAANTSNIVAAIPAPGFPVVVYDLSTTRPAAYTERHGGSHFNPLSALLTFGLAREVAARGAAGLALLAPYKQQASIMRLLARDTGTDQQLLVSTVHRLQGGESDFVFVDLTDSGPLAKPGILLSGEFGTQAMRLLNVAFSRARGKLVILCDLPFLRRTLPPDAILHTFFDRMAAMQVPFQPFPFELLRPATGGGTSFYFDAEQAWQLIYSDMAEARDRIIVNWPGVNLDEVLTDELVSWLVQGGAQVGVAGSASPAVKARLEGRGIVVAPTNAEEFVIQIGDDTFWVIGWNDGERVCRPFIRVKGGRCPNHLAELLGLNNIIAPVRRIHRRTRSGRTTARSRPVELLTNR